MTMLVKDRDDIFNHNKQVEGLSGAFAVAVPILVGPPLEALCSVAYYRNE